MVQTVGTVGGGRLSKVMRPCPTYLAGDVFEVGLLWLPCVLVRGIGIVDLFGERFAIVYD